MRVRVENFPIYREYRDFVEDAVLNTVPVNLQTLLNIHIWAPLLSRGPQLDYLLLQFITIARRILLTAEFMARFVSFWNLFNLEILTIYSTVYY